MMMENRVGMTPGWPASDNEMSNLLAQNWWAIAVAETEQGPQPFRPGDQIDQG